MLSGGQVQNSNMRGFGAIQRGDGGKKFREEFPELDEENWKWMRECQIDPQTGKAFFPTSQPSCSSDASTLPKRANGGGTSLGTVIGGGQAAREAGQSWLRRNWGKILIVGIFVYVVVARVMSEAREQQFS